MIALDKRMASRTVKWFSRVAISQHLARTVSDAVRSRPPLTGLHHHQTKTPGKKHNKKSVIVCNVTNDVEISRLSSYTCPHSFTPIRVKVINPTATLWRFI